MKRALFIPAALLLLNVASLAATSIVGKWRIDPTCLPPEVRKNAQALKMLDAARIEFKADGTVVSSAPGSPTEVSKYKVNGSTVSITDKKGTVEKATIAADGKSMSMKTGTVNLRFIRAGVPSAPVQKVKAGGG